MQVNNYKLWTAIITPMSQSGAIDFQTLTDLCKRQEKSGNALVVLGSTGEALALSDVERKQVIKHVMSLELNVPCLVGVGGANLDEQKHWMNYCANQGVHGYLVPTPLYAKPGDEGQYLWFKALLDHASAPVMLYNVPGRTCMPLSHIALKRLVGHKNLFALKEASGSSTEFAKYKAEMGSKLVLSGDDALTPEFAHHGCDGLVSVAANIWPSQTKIFLEKSLAKKLNDQDHQLWTKACDSLFLASNPIPTKALMHKLGMICSSALRLPLTCKDFRHYNKLVDLHEKIINWS